ncbi:carbon storage regulator [Botrimarina hoheduenensis]|uniref:Translational regulator CsrA n=1 Tax=Botrimarina hoheduenensis TaxID=2528000 RepID=A0A5C5WFD6_9BACT|nr:hypothetical protein Pla111_05700 [Botrimarina hoheduenensis]
MLVLTRKAQETIQIGNDITITVIKTKGKAVRLGIQAPAEVAVLRGELAAAINAAQEFGTPEHSPQDSSTAAVPSAGKGAERVSSPKPAKPKSDTAQAVRFERVTRSKVGTVLPNLLGEAGPLREMLQQRSTFVS